MGFPEQLAPQRQGFFQQRLGLFVAALIKIKHCQIIQTVSHSRMGFPEQLAPQQQGFFQQWLYILIATLITIEQR